MNNRRKRAARQRFEVLEGEGKRFSFSNFKQAFVFYVLLILAVVVMVQLGYHWLGEQFLSWRLKVIEAEVGLMEKQIYAEGFVTRSEEVITAPQNVVILSLAPEAKRVSAGEELARLDKKSAYDPAFSEEVAAETQEEPGLWEGLSDYWQTSTDTEETAEDSPEEEPLAPPFTSNEEGAELAGEAGESAETGEEEPPVPEGAGHFNADSNTLFLQAARPGLVSYYLDGLEDLRPPFYPDETKWPLGFTPGTEEENENEDKNEEEASNLLPAVIRKKGDQVRDGEPLLKLVDNWQWYFSVVLPLHEGRLLLGLDQIRIIFDFAPEEPAEGELYHAETLEAKQEVHLTYLVKKQLTGFERARLTGAALVYKRQSGIIVPASAVFEKDGQSGLFVNQGGRVVFKNVTVEEKEGDLLLVGGLEPQALVIARPDLVEEGQRFR